MITPLGSEGGVHETVSCTIPDVADKPDTGPGTVYMHVYKKFLRICCVCVYVYIYIYNIYIVHNQIILLVFTLLCKYVLHAYMYSAAKDKQLS